MLPAASQATSRGWLKLSPGTPDPGGPDARPNTPLLPSSPTASSLRPSVRRTLPVWSNLTTILEARSTIQTLSCGSTLTPCANRKRRDDRFRWCRSRAGTFRCDRIEEARAAVDVDARCANDGVRAAALVVDPQVARGGGGHAGHFTEMDVVRQLQKITGGFERDFFLLGGRARRQPASSAGRTAAPADARREDFITCPLERRWGAG